MRKKFDSDVFERVEQLRRRPSRAPCRQIVRKRLRISNSCSSSSLEARHRRAAASQLVGLFIGQQNAVRHRRRPERRDFEQRPVAASCAAFATRSSIAQPQAYATDSYFGLRPAAAERIIPVPVPQLHARQIDGHLNAAELSRFRTRLRHPAYSGSRTGS